MRFAVISLVIVALLTAWVMTKDPDSLESGPESTQRDISADVPQSQVDSGRRSQEERQNAQDERPESANSAGVTATPEGPNFEINPQMRDEMVGYFVGSGLSAADGERIVAAVFEDLKSCAEEVWSEEDQVQRSLSDMERLNGNPAFQACALNVIQDHGLPFADPTDAR